MPPSRDRVKSRGGWHWSKVVSGARRAIRDLLAERQGWLCHWCGEPMRQVPSKQQILDDDHVTIEHIVGLSEGGEPFDIRNLAAAHEKCNRERHATPPQNKEDRNVE